MVDRFWAITYYKYRTILDKLAAHETVESKMDDSKTTICPSPQWDPKILLDAVYQSDTKTLRCFFNRGCPSDFELNENGDTVLLIASALGLIEVCRLMLLEYSAKNDPHPDRGKTALQLAVNHGHPSIVELILGCAAPTGLDSVIVNHADENGEAPIHCASRCGSIVILELLVMHGANVGVVDSRGRTCLHLASQHGHISCLLLALEVGADEFLEVRDDDGWKCLDLAIRANNFQCVHVLLQTGAIVSQGSIELAAKKAKMLKLLLEYAAEDGSDCIFSGLNTFIASPEFQTPMSREEEVEDDEIERRLYQFIQNGETWEIYFTEDTFGERYFYNTVRDYSIWDDPRSRSDGVLSNFQQVQSSPRPQRSTLPHSSLDTNSKSYEVNQTPIANSSSVEEVVVSKVSVVKADSEAVPSQIMPPRENEADDTCSNFNALSNASPQNEDITRLKAQHCDVVTKQVTPKPPKESPSITLHTSPEQLDTKSIKETTSSKESKEAVTRDPKGMLLAQIRSRSTKEAPSIEPTEDPSQMKIQQNDVTSKQDTSKQPKEAPNFTHHPYPERLDTVKKVCANTFPDVKSESFEETTPTKKSNEAVATDPKSMLLAQIRSRRTEEAPSMESSEEGNEGNYSTPKKDHQTMNTTVPNRGLLAQIRKPAASDGLSSDSIDAFEKYSKMKAVGVPIPAIVQRITRDGVGEKQIQIFQQRLTGKINTPPQPKQAVHAFPAKSKEELLKDKALQKYVQMTRVGVPPAAVVMKMLQDKIDSKSINSFRVVHGLELSDKKAPAHPSAPTHRRSSRALQRVHWSTINEEEMLRDSLWNSKIDAEITQSDVEELESLFSASPRPSARIAIRSKRGKGGCHIDKRASSMIVESKRANNIAISLAQYRSFDSFDALVTAVASLDETNLNTEKITNMIALLPTTSELNQLNQLKQVDGLGRAELFFISVSKMPRFKEKLFCFQYLLLFEEVTSTLKTNLITLEKACAEVISSKNLAFVCMKLLKIGNLMNNQSASGATLHSLIKIAKKKGGGGKVSVIDHLISSIDNSNRICFKNDMPTLRDSLRLDIDEMKSTMKEIESGYRNIENTIKTEESADGKTQHSIKFLSIASPFQKVAAGELKTMGELVARAASRVEDLKRFFAEEPSSSSASIFSSLLEFSSIVESAKEAYHRKQNSRRRKDSRQRPRL